MIKTNNPATIIKGSSKYLWDNTSMMVYSLGQLFTGNVPLKDMHGVVAITKIGGDMIEKKSFCYFENTYLLSDCCGRTCCYL